MFDPGNLINESVQGRLLKSELDRQYDDNEFRFSFPAGTEVTDHVTKARYVTMEDGSSAAITKNYMHTYSSKKGLSFLSILMIIVVASVTLLLVGRAIRWRTQR
jgi:hypothetical protein